jgi:hypothetical protein
MREDRLWTNEDLNEVYKVYRSSKNDDYAIFRRAITNIYANMFGVLFLVFIVDIIWNKRLEVPAHPGTNRLKHSDRVERDNSAYSQVQFEISWGEQNEARE